MHTHVSILHAVKAYINEHGRQIWPMQNDWSEDVISIKFCEFSASTKLLKHSNRAVTSQTNKML